MWGVPERASNTLGSAEKSLIEVAPDCLMREIVVLMSSDRFRVLRLMPAEHAASAHGRRSEARQAERRANAARRDGGAMAGD